MLHHLCYASGNSEPGGAAPSVTTAKKRIDNYGAGFLKGKARAVLADGHRGPVDYLEAIFTTNQTIESLWRKAPNANGNVTSFAGTRSVGATAFMDPGQPHVGLLPLAHRRPRSHDQGDHRRVRRPGPRGAQGRRRSDLRRDPDRDRRRRVDRTGRGASA